MNNDQTKDKPKAKRRIKKFDFSGSNAAVALVSTDQGGPANGAAHAYVIKGANFSEEFLQKMQQVKVTLELPDFLQRFFGLWEDDAKTLAHMMGYVEPAESQTDEYSEAQMEYQDWIESRMEALEIIKSAKDAENLSDVLSALSEDEYLALLRDQESLEKAMFAIEKQKESPVVDDSTEADVETSIASEVEGKGISPVVKQNDKDVTMNKGEPSVDVIEKAAFDALQKQAEESQALLKSALAELEIFKAEKAEMITKARKQSIVLAVKDEATAESLFKSIESLPEDKFNGVVDLVKSLVEQVNKSSLFQEQGVTADQTDVSEAESAVARILKAQFANK